MERQEDKSMVPAFIRKPSEESKSPVPSHPKSSLHVMRSWCVKEREGEGEGEGEEEDEDAREEIESKIHALQKIVPGAESLAVDKLFDETAAYILALQYQVKALRTLTSFFDNDNSKFGA